jgi:hypothetical protein
VEGSDEHGNEPSGSIKYWKFLEQLHNWRLFKKGAAPFELINRTDGHDNAQKK